MSHETRESDPPTGRMQWAIRSGPAVALFLLVAAFGVGSDLLSKHFIFERLLDDPTIERQVREIT